ASLPPRGATLFPYTTLFRSFGTIEARGLRAFADRWESYRREGRGEATSAELLLSVDGYGPHDPLPVTLQPAPGEIEALAQEARKDRKSTRLNSSHVKISYAV